VKARPEKALILWWGEAEEVCAKNSGASASVAVRRNNFTLARARSWPDFTWIEASQPLKGQIEIYLRRWWSLALGLMHALIKLLFKGTVLAKKKINMLPTWILTLLF
jgi:hypothetical protein